MLVRITKDFDVSACAHGVDFCTCQRVGLVGTPVFAPFAPKGKVLVKFAAKDLGSRQDAVVWVPAAVLERV